MEAEKVLRPDRKSMQLLEEIARIVRNHMKELFQV